MYLFFTFQQLQHIFHVAQWQNVGFISTGLQVLAPSWVLRFFPKKLNYVFYDISKTCNFLQLLKISQGLHQPTKHFLLMTLRDIMQLLEDRIFFATVLSHSTVAKKFGKISCQIPEPLGCTVQRCLYLKTSFQSYFDCVVIRFSKINRQKFKVHENFPFKFTNNTTFFPPVS